MTDGGAKETWDRPAKRARCCDTADDLRTLPLQARLPAELWSRVFAAVDDPAAAAAWRATSATARRLFDALPGHDPSCGGNRALYEACRRADDAAVGRLLNDRRVVTALCRDGPNRHGSLFGHESVAIACRLLAASTHSDDDDDDDDGDARTCRLRVATHDVEAACSAARTSDSVPLLLLGAAPTRTQRNPNVPIVASTVGVTEACLDAAIAHRRPLLLRALLAFVASHDPGVRDYGDMPARAAVCAVRRRDAAMLRIVLDADGYRAPEAALARDHGGGDDDDGSGVDGQVDPLCEAVRHGWTDGVCLVSTHRRYAVPGTHEPPLDAVQRMARAWCVALAYWMAVRMRRALALGALTRSHRPTWCHPESPHAIDALLAHGPTRTFVALVKTAPMARKVAQRAAATGHAVALGLALARVRRLCVGMPQGLFVRAVAKAAAATSPRDDRSGAASPGRCCGGCGAYLSRLLTDALATDVNALVGRLLRDSSALNGRWAPVPDVDSNASDDSDPPAVDDDWARVKRSGYLDRLPD
ncbi:hypothetical protein psal_cds_399 [Pandoravirus salinus]|uniref:Uncharacterized protein n=1 Tax=Pandoravirus salinus TaxID=1349410 RepID=S4VUS2_9VIRU|nr:hypothetical protein psal_cds_399 [Pandoravirus salinus]AGO84098.1 hypothetical protein psal_cds_399 [Pandoravirus salinus]